MGQRPTSVRVKLASGDESGEHYARLTVGELARLLGVSERTIFRRLRAGEFERVEAEVVDKPVTIDVRHMTVINGDDSGIQPQNRGKIVKFDTIDDRHSGIEPGVGGDSDRSYRDADPLNVLVLALKDQLREKDIQISQLMMTHRETREMIGRLQDQMYELTKFSVEHHAEMERARLLLEQERMRENQTERVRERTDAEIIPEIIQKRSISPSCLLETLANRLIKSFSQNISKNFEENFTINIKKKLAGKFTVPGSAANAPSGKKRARQKKGTV